VLGGFDRERIGSHTVLKIECAALNERSVAHGRKNIKREAAVSNGWVRENKEEDGSREEARALAEVPGLAKPPRYQTLSGKERD
jgi:hypothetical protein